MPPMVFALFFVVAVVVVAFLAGIRIVRPTHRGLVERLGKYRRLAADGGNPLTLNRRPQPWSASSCQQ